MDTDQGWWSRNLGRPVQPAQQPQGYQQPAPQPQQGYQQPQQQAPPQQQQIQVTPGNLFEVAGLWQGGEAARTETQRCPNCNGGHFYSRAGVNVRGPAPAPLCMDCGFTGMFVQGDPAVWQT